MSRGRLTYVGHATVLVEDANLRILTDPLLRRRVAHLRRRVPVPSSDDLADLDAVLISHAHADHLDLRSLRRLRHNGLVVVPRGCRRIIVRAGGQPVELTPGDRHAVGSVHVEALPAHHDGRRHPLARRTSALGYLLDGPSRIYFAGDTDLFDEMEMLADRVDVALLPVSGWGPRLPPGHLDPLAAARAAALIRPAIAIPIHWGTMRSFAAPSDAHRAHTFAAAVAKLAPAVEVRVLAPGEFTSLRG
jgi:L-ascorbate metabolism protein UlaG (beta-lactamase superfamily)